MHRGHSQPVPADDGRRAMHVWVRRPGHAGEERLPGLLLMMRRTRTRSGRPSWEGWVVYASVGHPEGDGPVVTQGWVEVGSILPG